MSSISNGKRCSFSCSRRLLLVRASARQVLEPSDPLRKMLRLDLSCMRFSLELGVQH